MCRFNARDESAAVREDGVSLLNGTVRHEGYVGERLHRCTHARNVPAEFVELSAGERVCADFSFMVLGLQDPVVVVSPRTGLRFNVRSDASRSHIDN